MSLNKLADRGDDPLAKRERRKEARPGELLDAALDLFVEKGFAATRSEEVAARPAFPRGPVPVFPEQGGAVQGGGARTSPAASPSG